MTFKNKHHSEGTKNKMSLSKTGRNNSMYGKHHSEETRQKMREKHLGENSPFWKDGRSRGKFKYKQRMVNGKLKYVHRLIMEDKLGRELDKTEFVHHRDGNVLNNNINNLELIPNGIINHAKFHSENRKLGL